MSWLKREQVFIRFVICRLPRYFSGEAFWLKSSPFSSVSHSEEELRVTCNVDVVPRSLLGESCEGGFVGLLIPSSLATMSVLQSLLEKFILCGVSISTLDTLSDGTRFIMVAENNVALLQCAVQELWDEHYVFSFEDSPVRHTSALESRQLTMLASMYRHYKPIHTIPKRFTIHCLGAESKECSNISSLLSVYSLLFRSLVYLGVIELELAFIGPNLLPSDHNDSTCFFWQDKLEVRVTVSCDLYHDFVQRNEPAHLGNIDLVILFQAGLWGYDSWHPTLALFPSLPITQVVVTSYSSLEGENDFDTLEQLCLQRAAPAPGDISPSLCNTGCDAVRQCFWNFEDEKNPYACTVPIPRTSAPDCDTYYDNYTWQSVSFVLTPDPAL